MLLLAGFFGLLVCSVPTFAEQVNSGEDIAVPVIVPNPIFTAIYVEPRCHAALGLVLRTTLSNLDGYPVVLWHTVRNAKYVIGVIRSDPLIRKYWEHKLLTLHSFDPKMYGSTRTNNISEPLSDKALYHGDFWYQRLITMAPFWNTIKTPFMVNVQSDTLICNKPPLDIISKSTFIGGISGFNSKGRFKVADDPKENTLTPSHMNGGFSVHSVEWSLKCIALDSKHFYVEDTLWNKCRDTIDTPGVPEADAYRIASDNGITACFTFKGERLCPFGVHKPWNKASATAWTELQQTCDGLSELKALQYENFAACPNVRSDSFI
eukprot:m.10392 g.10392  ORF g.10392 m.10392 type:complete len:321 (-) comp8271_c0_seq1:149-1111(-)